MKLTLQDLKDISLVLYAHNLRGLPPNKDIEPLRQKVERIIALKDLALKAAYTTVISGFILFILIFG